MKRWTPGTVITSRWYEVRDKEGLGALRRFPTMEEAEYFANEEMYIVKVTRTTEPFIFEEAPF